MRTPYVALLLLAPLAAGCVLRPSLDGRACDDGHPCVTGYHCAAGVCAAGEGPQRLVDAGRPDAGARDGGLVDAGFVDAGRPDAGASDAGLIDAGQPDAGDAGACPVPAAPPDEAWLSSFTITPAAVRVPGTSVDIQWSTVGMESCALLWLTSSAPDRPTSGGVGFLLDTSYSFTLRCTSGDEIYEATRVVPVGPAVLDVDAIRDRTCVVIEGGVVRCWGVAVATPYPPAPERVFGDSSDEVGGGLPLISLADPDGGPSAGGTSARSLSLGSTHDCALLDDGRVKCWGENAFGELGLENDTAYDPVQGYTALPAARLGDRRVTSVTPGGDTTCASFDDGSVSCWGSDGEGRLGNGALSTASVGSTAGSMDALYNFRLGDEDDDVVSLVGPRGARCALLESGRLKCWGSAENGVLGSGDAEDRGDDDGEVGPALAAVDLGAGHSVVDVALSYHACAILDDASVKCWGLNTYGSLGYGGVDDDAGPDQYVGDEPGEMGGALPAVNLGTGVEAVRVTSGTLFTCAVLSDGRVKCWGENSWGRLGHGVRDNRIEPAELGDALPYVDIADVDVVDLSAGHAHTCALLADASLKCWGRNQFGQLGLGDTDNRGDGPDEMGANLPRVDVGPFVPEAFTLAGVRRRLQAQGCTSCHSADLPPFLNPVEPPFNGCLSDLVESDAYGLGTLDPDSDEGRLRCLHWHLTEECAGGHRGLVDVERPDRSLLLREPYCAGSTCAPPASAHPEAGFQDRRPGSDFAYLFHWIARGAPGLDDE